MINAEVVVLVAPNITRLGTLRWRSPFMFESVLSQNLHRENFVLILVVSPQCRVLAFQILHLFAFVAVRHGEYRSHH